MRGKSLLCLSALLLSTMLMHSPAAADDPNTATMGADTAQQIDWIQSSLDAGSVSSKRWQYGWCTAYGGMTYLYAGQALMLDESSQSRDRHDATINSASSFAGLVSTMVFPMKTHTVAEILKGMPESTEAQKQAKLQQAETFLRESAEREALGRSWQAHAFGAAVSALAGVAVAGDDGRGTDGLITFATNLLVSEIQIFTTPTRASEDWQRYQQGRPGPSATSNSASRFFISAFSEGLIFHYLF